MIAKRLHQTASIAPTKIQPNSASPEQVWQTNSRIDQSDCVDQVDLAGFSGFG